MPKLTFGRVTTCSIMINGVELAGVRDVELGVPSCSPSHDHLFVKDARRLGYSCAVDGCSHFKPAAVFDHMPRISGDTA